MTLDLNNASSACSGLRKSIGIDYPSQCPICEHGPCQWEDPPKRAPGTLMLPHPLHGDKLYRASTVLRDLAGQEGCDGEPYDTMQRLAVLLDQQESAN